MEIVLVRELFAAYRKGEIEPKGWYAIYWTEEHKKNNSIGFIPGEVIPDFVEAFDKANESFENQLLWGKIKK